MIPPTHEQLAEFKRLAQAAKDDASNTDAHDWFSATGLHMRGHEDADAAFIAACSPDVVLALVEALVNETGNGAYARSCGEQYARESDALRAHVAELEKRNRDQRRQLHDLQKAYDAGATSMTALQERVVELEAERARLLGWSAAVFASIMADEPGEDGADGA